RRPGVLRRNLLRRPARVPVSARRTCVPVLLCLATVELFLMAPEFGRLFPEVLIARDTVIDPEHLAAARQGVGSLPPGHWYCPIVAPLVGGSARPSNFMAMTPGAFAAATVEEWRALR